MKWIGTQTIYDNVRLLKSLYLTGDLYLTGELYLTGSLYDSTGGTGTLPIVAGDITVYNAVNGGDPTISLGSSATERLEIKAQYESGAQGLDGAIFTTYTAGSSTNDGRFTFFVDEVGTFQIRDNGINLYAGKSIQMGNTDILTDDGSGATTLNNIDALDATTISTFNAALTAGDITGVTAGDGLSGGGTSGAVTLTVEAAQPNVTSLGTLTALQVDNINLDGSTITNSSGNLTIANTVDNGDIIFQGDDGAGGDATYITLDGSAATHDGSATTKLVTVWPDKSRIVLGSGSDLQLYHDGSNSFIAHGSVGDLTIEQNADDKDILFKCDNGAGGNINYFRLDGSAAVHDGSATTATTVLFQDNCKLKLGVGGDLALFHDGSDSVMTNNTGDLYIRNAANDKDIILQSDDGSGGVTAYLTLDGSTETVEVAKEMNLAVSLATDQQKHIMHYPMAGYATGDGTNYEMVNNLSDNNAPFEHNISIGADGVTATTVQNIVRSAGVVMPRACTLKRWTGWSTSAGSAATFIGLFKVTPVDNTAGSISFVELEEFEYTAVGNAKTRSFDISSSFTETAIAAGDIILTGIKGASGAAINFTSTFEVEF